MADSRVHTEWIAQVKDRVRQIVTALAQSENTPIITLSNSGHASNVWHLQSDYLIRGAVSVESHNEMVFIKQSMEWYPIGNRANWLLIDTHDGVRLLKWISEVAHASQPPPPPPPPPLDVDAIMKSVDMFINTIWDKAWKFKSSSPRDWGDYRIVLLDSIHSHWFHIFHDYFYAFVASTSDMIVESDLTFGDAQREITVYFDPDSMHSKQFFPSDVLVRFLSSG